MKTHCATCGQAIDPLCDKWVSRMSPVEIIENIRLGGPSCVDEKWLTEQKMRSSKPYKFFANDNYGLRY